VLQFASLNFDASISEIVITLCAGATLCLASKADLLPGPDLLRTLTSHVITHVTLPPSVLSVMPATALPALQVLIVAGEACPAKLVEEWSNVCTVINAYGPTESTVCASGMEYDGKSITPVVPIGRPIENIQLYILDQWQQPAPIGVPGELYIGGVGLARGYLNRPNLTQERFIHHPFDPTPDSRLYKTGDLTRYLPDGNIEFLGRIDHQVKLRGFRIELGEIEATLSRHPGVREVAVLLREDSPEDKRLVADLVGGETHDSHISEVDFREYLISRLPEYMIPSVFVILERFPITPNGKVDRHALPIPDVAQRDIRETYVAPRTAIEKQLAELWAEVLKIDQIGIYDDFFELGGHSLLATQLVSRVRAVFQADFPLVRLFEMPTIANLASVIEQAAATAAPSQLPSITRVSRKGRQMRRSAQGELLASEKKQKE
jgi:acyl-coenzyme A synthetase/AMP-(fatty) acid ligase/acyl carrier protein